MEKGKYIEWKDRFSVGDNGLNDDHKDIITVINDLYIALQNKEGQAVVKETLYKLLEYTKNHFSREEHILEKVAYPDLQRHKGLHRKMVQRTKELMDRNSSNEDSLPQEAMLFLKDWWIDHIISMDMRYKTCIEEFEKPRPQ